VSECQVQRTLVKSPPELWEALSDPAALARHLGEFGEIRITRVEPETTVEWEAEHVSGTVEITPSGWGTKVTLTATPAAPEPAPEPEPDPETTTALVVWTEPQPFPPPVAPEPEPTSEPVAEAEPEAAPEPPAFEADKPVVAQTPPFMAAPRRSWFQRLFGRGEVAEVPPEPAPPAPVELPVEPQPTPDPEPPADPPPAAHTPLATMEPDVATVEFSVPSLWKAEDAETGPQPDPQPEPQPDPEPEPQPEPQPDPEPDPGPESEPVPVIDGERATAVLTSVLDDLGAAHHRPFSR
jgi:hypothetical protein